ncbi:MAG: VCBS repeat-containing protein [Planctomycetota bacterium]
MLRTTLVPGCALAASALFCSTARAQQFVLQSGVFSPDKIWTEGVEPADVDQDGDLDIFFGQGDGYSSAGTKRQNKLWINKFETTANDFDDESVARLGVNKSNAKMVITGDTTGDGYPEALFCNAFDTDPCFLYVNKGAAQPGFFVLDSASRGLGGVYSSASGQFGDLDNDGDLDLILCDSGSDSFGNPGGTPHLFFNDGRGYFTENAAALNAPTKKAHMDVQLVDLDGDFDLDFFGACRASNSGGNHYLMLNNGSGQFTDNSGLLPGTSAMVYEAEVGDLDNDSDVDLFFVSLSGFSEGVVRSNDAQLGVLSFTAGSTVGGDDDNEIVLIDFDNDGDLDAAVGSLGSSEKLQRNNGNLSFSSVSSDFTAVGDSTLDMCCADFDNDGDYDIVTAQGESGSNQWDSKLYVNTGSKDTLPPVVVRQESLPAFPPANGPWVVRAQVRDQVMDDGNDWVRGSAQYRIDTALGTGAWQAADATRMGGGLWRFAMRDVAEGLGQQLVYTLTFTDWAGNATTTNAVTVPLGPTCGFTTYGNGIGGANVLTINGSGQTTPGSSFNVTVVAPGLPAVATILSFGRDNFPIFGGTGLINPLNIFSTPIVPVVNNKAVSTWPIGPSASLVGIHAHFQGIAFDATQPGGWAISNGLEVGICN